MANDLLLLRTGDYLLLRTGDRLILRAAGGGSSIAAIAYHYNKRRKAVSRYLKQSTAFSFRAGPFVDSTDGVTPETGLSIGQADIQISKDGGAFAQTSTTPTATHDVDGFYICPLTAGDTDTLGPLRVQITVSGAVNFSIDTSNWSQTCLMGKTCLTVLLALRQ